MFIPFFRIQPIIARRCDKNRLHRQNHQLRIGTTLYAEIVGARESKGKVAIDALGGNHRSVTIVCPEDCLALGVAHAVEAGLAREANCIVAVGIKGDVCPNFLQRQANLSGVFGFILRKLKLLAYQVGKVVIKIVFRDCRYVSIRYIVPAIQHRNGGKVIICRHTGSSSGG